MISVNYFIFLIQGFDELTRALQGTVSVNEIPLSICFHFHQDYSPLIIIIPFSFCLIILPLRVGMTAKCKEDIIHPSYAGSGDELLEIRLLDKK